MKKHIIVILVLLAGLVMPAMAQNKKVDDRIQLAREKYAEGLALIAENAEGEGLGYTTVAREQMWAAVGPRFDTIQFYYNELRDDEEEPYPDGYALRMVRHTYNITVRNHFEEYLFDDNEKPLFYFTRFTELIDDDKFDFPLYGNAEDGLPEFEVRHYYDENGKLIRSIYKTLDENGKMKEFTEKSHPGLLDELYYSPEFDYVKKIFDAIY